MKFFFDLAPVALFFAAYFIFDSIYVATAVIIPATIAQAAWEKFRYGKVDTMLWISLALVCVMGGLTLFLHDKRFIMWKPTLLYWAFVVALVASRVVWKKNLIKSLLGKEMVLPEGVWNQLNAAWALFFLVMGFVNIYVASNFDEAFWVKFKLFGFTGLLMLFVLLQAPFLARHLQHKESSQGNP
jgi:intracellular septation protein